MAWNINDQVTTNKLNTENHIPNWSFSWTASNNNNDTHTIGHQLFYCHDCEGSNNPIIIEWHAQTIDEKYWFKWYNPWITMWIEKRDAAGNIIGSRYTIITAHHGDENLYGSLTISDLISTFGSAEGWYYLYYDCRDDKHGSATMWYKSYFYPNNNAVGRPLRYYTSPSSSGFIPGKEISALNLNSHNIGTY